MRTTIEASYLAQPDSSQKVCALRLSMGHCRVGRRLSAASTRLPSGTVPKKYPPAAASDALLSRHLMATAEPAQVPQSACQSRSMLMHILAFAAFPALPVARQSSIVWLPIIELPGLAGLWSSNYPA